MTESGDDNFSRKFKHIELFRVRDKEIPKDVLIKKECRKIPKIKSFNTATAIRREYGVYFRDTTCSSCENCLQGNMLNCTSDENGD